MPQQSTAKYILRLLASLKTNEDKIAVIDQNGQRQTTYKELFTMACRVTGYLQKKNFPPHSYIGISLPTSMEYVAAEIGIWLAGHAIVPMGDKYPQDRIDYIMHHCESPLLINDEIIQAMMKTEPTENYILPNEDDVNALFYTSGSTGVPKGVMHSFRSLNFAVTFDLELMQTVSPLTLGVTSPPYFIASRFYFSALLLGGKVHFPSTMVTKDIRLLENYIDKHHVTFIFLTPSLLRFFHNQSSSLQVLLTGSERLADIAPGGSYRLIHTFGQTETFGPLLYFEVDKLYDNTPMGKAHPTFEALVVDENGKSVKLGEPGELCFKGTFARCYYKDEEQTAHLYRGGMLHTNDIVRQLPDGNLIYLNRQDWMVKINGQRVEPSEVESALRNMDGVDDAVVKGFTTNGRQFLCAYYIANEEISEDTIRKDLRSKLPAYMVPAYFVRMDSFPLLPNGKTDRKSLTAPSVLAEGVVRPPYVEPTNFVERQLCEAFEKALSMERVGIDDDFFELGGDSIRVMEVQTLCPELLLSSQMIYANRTPKKLAEACAYTAPVSYIPQKDYPLSHTQLGIYVESMTRQGEVIYNNGMLFQLNPAIDTDLLSKACETVVEAHPYIKTRLFVDSQGNPRQLRNDAEPYHQNIETLTQEEFEKLKPELIHPFDLLNDCLFRIRILKTQEAQYLFMDFHHIIFDGMSFNTIIKDLKDAYEQLPVERETFTGYEIALEEESLRKTEAYTTARQWYMEQFGSLKVSSLPMPEKQDSHITYGHENLELRVDYNQLQKAADNLGVTPNVLTTTVFGYLLGVNTHAQESLFATIFSGRQDLKSQRTVSMLVRTMPVYTKWDEGTTVRGLLQTTKQQLMGSMSNSLFSFAEIKAMNNAINSHILFAYQGDLKPSDNELFTYQPLMENATGEDLAFEILQNETKLILHTEYHSNQYTQSFILRLMHCYETILSGFLSSASEDKRLCELPILTEDEQKSIIALGTGDQLEYDKSETVVDLFHRQATVTPDNIAVVDEVSEITYAELDRRSDLLAIALIKAGVSTDTPVAIMLPRRKEFLVAVFAIFKAGGAYVPLDSEYPKDRLAYILNDSDAQLLITTSTLSKDCQTEQYYSEEKQLFIDDFDFNDPSDHHVNFAQPSGLAYMIYTSGTTGQPKGVMIEHKSLRAYLEWHNELLRISPEDHCALHSTFSFDASIDDLIPPLINGAQLHILSSELRHNMQEMNDYFKKHNIVGLTLSTQLGIEMLNTYQLPLKFLLMGGSKMSHVPVGSTKVINGYGPTEFTVCSSFYILEEDDKHENIPIGRPVPNSISVIVDAEGRLVPQGTVGELCLIGSQISRGYWKQEELTNKRFDDCAFLHGQKMYRTGDLVRWNEEGLLEYVGRIDNQVKLNGFRIELEEIGNKISQCSGVTSAVAVIHKHSNIEYIVAYYTSEGNKELPAIQETLTATLPSYMMPSRIIRIDQMPLTPNGKIDVKALPIPNLDHEQVVKPETSMEKQVFDIVSEQLNSSSMGVTDNLVFYGLSSLIAMRLCVILQRRFGTDIKMSDIMKAPTVRAIVSLLGKAKGNHLPVYEPQPYYPLMENQRGLFFEWKKNPDTTQYNIPIIYSFGNIDAERLAAALEQTINAHPYLKSKILEIDGEVVLQRNDEAPVEVRVSLLHEEPDNIYFQKILRPFHLLDNPLYRIELLKTPQKTYLFIDVHHIIFDGLSRDVFMNDLKRAYDGETLEVESYQAYDFARYEQDELKDTEKTKEAEAWYDELLTDANAISLPSYSTPDGVDYAEVEVCIHSDKIKDFCAQNGVTVNSYMHAAFAVFAKHIIKEDNPLYLTISNGRDISVNLQQCVGMFVKTMPIVIKSDLAQRQTTANFLKEVHQQLNKSYRMDNYPYTRIVERHQINAELMFLFQDVLNDNTLWEGMEQVQLSLDTPKFPLSIVVTPINNGYLITFEYDGKRYNHQGMLQMAKAFKNVCLGMAESANVDDIELVSQEEKSKLLELSKGEILEYDQSETIIDLFERQVTKTPDAIAVVDCQGYITYKELDNQSNILAHKLMERGVGKNDFVGVMLPRRKEFLVAVLGVFKAGGAYIPLDHEYPDARLLFMLNDAQAKFLLSTHSLVENKDLYMNDTGLFFIDDIDVNSVSASVNHSEASSLAYMIYTSGSTGKPKGVIMQHKGLCALAKWLIPMEGLKSGDKCAEHASFSFDASLLDLLTPLTCGAEVHILSSELRLDPEGMCKYFREQHITGISMSTQLGMEMINNYDLSLRFMVMGGEKMNLLRKTSVKLINEYGPTEFAVCSSYHIINQEREYNTIPIGRPVPNSMSVVVDNMGHLVPEGIPGELCLIGRQMAQGYWNRPELTEKHFTDCPFIAGEKMYHTGDLVYWNNDGELEYLGRMDSQFKIRGYRVELGEIENKIAEFPGVTSAAVIVHQKRKTQYIIGFFTSITPISTEKIQEYLRQQLPDFMIPQFMIQLSAMPMSPNGKINRKKLINNHQMSQLFKNGTVAPMTNNEKIFYDLAKQVLKVDHFGVTDDLSLIGLTSLSAIKLVDLAHQKGLFIKVNDILRNKSIRSILTYEQSIGKWENGYDASKPVIVLIQGFTYYKLMEPFISKLSKHYSVFVFEPLDDHYNILFSEDNVSSNDVVNFYLDYLEANLPSNVNVQMFIGHSFGGELAYRCAVRWHKKTGIMPKICMLDTYVHVNDILLEIPIPEIVNPTPDEASDIKGLKESNRHFRQRLAMLEEHDLPSYDGDVLYFEAEELAMPLKTNRVNEHEVDQKRKEDLNNWKSLVPRMSIYPVSADHFTMLDDHFCDYYIDKIKDIVLPHNS